MGNVDQRGIDNQPPGREARRAPHWIGGREAAALLGVKRETLYAYASRGLVRSEPAGAGRERRYRREDLLRLKARRDARAGHGPVAAGALRWGEPVLESALTAIDAGGPRYRGHRAADLGDRASFEAVAELLWTGALPAGPPAWRVPGIGLDTRALAALLPEGAHPLTTLALAVPALAAADPTRFDTATEVEHERARALVLRMAALLGFARDPARAEAAVAAGSVARALLAGLGVDPTDRAARAIDRVLILLADHELNPSSFTVRVAASTRADLYACTSAGLAALSGPRHGGNCDRVEALVAEVGRPDHARRALLERSRRGELVYGFGHPLYPEGDPRTAPLLRSALEIAPRRASVRTVVAIVEEMARLGREPASVDLGLVALAHALGLPPGSAAGMFAVGRAAGWAAHVFEQRAQGFILRPRARYVGP